MTTERTGKGEKLQMVLAVGVIAIGIAYIWIQRQRSGDSIPADELGSRFRLGILCVVVGFVWLLIAKAAIWWKYD